jgi:hypothetical protein
MDKIGTFKIDGSHFHHDLRAGVFEVILVDREV